MQYIVEAKENGTWIEVWRTRNRNQAIDVAGSIVIEGAEDSRILTERG